MLPCFVDGTPDAQRALERLCARGESDFTRVESEVRAILAAVRTEGDAAVLRYAARFDKRRPTPLVTREFHGANALGRLAPEARETPSSSRPRASALFTSGSAITTRAPSTTSTTTAAISARASRPSRAPASTPPEARRATRRAS